MRPKHEGVRVELEDEGMGTPESPETSELIRSAIPFARGTGVEIVLPPRPWDELLDLEAAADPVLVVLDGYIVASNRHAEVLVGRTKRELCDLPLDVVLSTTHDGDPTFAGNAGIRFIGREAGVEVRRRDGSALPVRVVVCSTRSDAVVLLVRATEGDETMCEQDMAGIVHDLKNPLSTIAIDAQVLGLTNASSSVQSQILRIERNVAYMDRLVQELLDLCSIDEGCLMIQRRPVELRSLIENVLDRALPPAHRDRVFLDGRENVIVSCDENRIERVVANLVENALKYSSAGSEVIVRLRVEMPVACVSVIDCGPGLSPSECHAVFGRFRRASTARGHGSGLGLYVSRKIIEAHGGRLAVESVPGVGSRFYFELPVTKRGGVATE